MVYNRVAIVARWKIASYNSKQKLNNAGHIYVISRSSGHPGQYTFDIPVSTLIFKPGMYMPVTGWCAPGFLKLFLPMAFVCACACMFVCPSVCHSVCEHTP